MKLDIEKIKSQVGCTVEEFAEEMNITVDELNEYCNGKPMPAELLSNMCEYTGLGPSAGGIYIADNQTKFNARPINPENTFDTSEEVRSTLLDFIKCGFNEIKEETVHTQIEQIEKYVKTLRKPRISFAGQSDTGKSTIINALLGAEKMPAKWTPTTSIVVYIKHIDDKPEFIKEDVWIFGKHNSEQWNDSRLYDEEYCNDFLIEKGDFSLLSTFGTHQNQREGQEIASSAVAFIDSPLLKDCDILDLPGFAANAEDDALHKFNTQDNVTDILIYLSRSNGFLQDRDLDYLRLCIKSLRAVEKNGYNNIEKLGNLFIVASQAGTVNNGNIGELNEILDRRCKALCDSYALAAKENMSYTLLPTRTKLTGYEYNSEDFRKRFFTYEKNMSRLCKKFNDSFTSLAEDLPKAMYNDFIDNLNSIINHSSKVVQDRIIELEDLIKNKKNYVELLKEIEAQEPARKAMQKTMNDEMFGFIDSLSIETKQDIQSIFNDTINQANLIDLINSQGIRNKKSDKQDFATTINELLDSKIQKIISEQSKKYAEKVEQYLNDYENSFVKYSEANDIPISYDPKNSFAVALGSLGALGASATWLATSFTAWSVITLGPLAGWASIAAVGGVVGIAVGAIIAGFLAIKALITWKKDLAKAIIKAYKDENFLDKVFGDVEKYWKDTRVSFEVGINEVEEKWQERIEEYKSLADEKNIPILEDKIDNAKKGLDFFTQIPLPNIG